MGELMNPQVSSLVDKIRQEARGYIADDGVQQELAEVTMVPIIGPLAVGKTSCMTAIESDFPDFAMVRGLTTRPIRDGEDKNTYRFLRHDAKDLSDILGKMNRRALVQVAVHPTTGYVYGSEPIDYSKPFTMLDTLAGAISFIRQLPFRRIVEIGMIAPPVDWWHRIDVRNVKVGKEDTRNRLTEAVMSLEWLLDQGPAFPWVVNRDGHLEETAREVVSIARGNITDTSSNRHVGELLLGSIKDAL